MALESARPMHTDGKSIADEINRVVASIPDVGATELPHQAHVATDADSAAVNTGIITPANVVYTQADQTALANDVIALITKHNTLVTDFNALVASYNLLLDHLIAAGLMA